jgi:hypothetical protein
VTVSGRVTRTASGEGIHGIAIGGKCDFEMVPGSVWWP